MSETNNPLINVKEGEDQISESDLPIVKHYAGRPMENRVRHTKQDFEAFMKGNPTI